MPVSTPINRKTRWSRVKRGWTVDRACSELARDKVDQDEQVSAGIPLSAVALAAASASGALSITIPMDAVALAQAVATGALSGGTDTFTPYVGRTWTPGYAPRIWEPLASQRTWVAAANNRTWRR